MDFRGAKEVKLHCRPWFVRSFAFVYVCVMKDARASRIFITHERCPCSRFIE